MSLSEPSSSVRAAFQEQRAAVERALDGVCVAYLAPLPTSVSAAIEYGIRSPGKRLRPLLVLCSYSAAAGAADASLLACSPEIIHSYSLIHDDLPCMDDDDMRRGRPTVHRVHGSRTAITAGACMIPIAVAVARDALAAMGVPAGRARACIGALLEGAGAGGMIGGQQRDLAGEGASLGIEEREAVHSAKTGALITACVRMGALAADADRVKVDALTDYGRSIGLAFQIMDDVLDLTSTTSTLGKTAGRDATLGKSTYPDLLGVAPARARAEALVRDALTALSEQNLLTQDLSDVANFMVTRTS